MIKESNILRELQIKKNRVYGGFVLKDFTITKEKIKKNHEYGIHIFLTFHGEIYQLQSLLDDLNSKIENEKIIYDVINRYTFNAKKVSMNSIKMDNNFFKIKITGILKR